MPSCVQQGNKIATLAAERGIPLYPYGYSTDIVIAANLHLIAANRNAPPFEYCVENSLLRWDVVEEDFAVQDGTVSIPEAPGLGVTLNRGTLDRYRTEYWPKRDGLRIDLPRPVLPVAPDLVGVHSWRTRTGYPGRTAVRESPSRNGTAPALALVRSLKEFQFVTDQQRLAI